MSLENHLFVGLDSDMRRIELINQLTMSRMIFQGAGTAQVDAISEAVVGHRSIFVVLAVNGKLP